MHRFILSFLAFMILASCTNSAPESLGTAPEFSLPAVDARTISLSDYKGSQPVLLFFHMAVG